MNIRTNSLDESGATPADFGPHFVAPPPKIETGPDLPPVTTTQHRSGWSVLLHWSLMLGGFAALALLGHLL
ncbi:hypothetical protein [Paracoccus aestuariivivens]|uniref:Uncharacterized protein n=1 Tax=Paracoccus aestuariivivens TaxID=1820333 RepID=A0A6L6JCR0_9RHOB|nr:hypothetical protein [Paracoccus aestuariivivens]MTH78985.1 hypothetical protein [Paracoccus aestuariivivens]